MATRAWFVFVWLASVGCDGATGMPDAAGRRDAGRDGGRPPAPDGAAPDAIPSTDGGGPAPADGGGVADAPPPDAGVDALGSLDAATDAIVTPDARVDALTMLDAGADAIVTRDGAPPIDARVDAGALRDAALPDAPARDAGPSPNCFSRDDLARVTPRGLEVMRQIVPLPRSDEEDGHNYRWFPATSVIARPWGSSLTTMQTEVDLWELMWSDRLNDASIQFNRPNDHSGAPEVLTSEGFMCRPEFTTYEKAIGSTVVKMMWSAGYLPRADPDGVHVGRLLTAMGLLSEAPTALGWLDAADAFGFSTTLWNAHLDDPTVLHTDVAVNTGPISHLAFIGARADALCVHVPVAETYRDRARTTRDIVFLGRHRLADYPDQTVAAGFIMDFEMDDERSPALLLRTVQLYSALTRAKGYGLVLAMDPLTGAGSRLGLTPANGNTILGLVTAVNLFIVPDRPEGAEAYLDGVVNTFFRGPDGTREVDYSKIFLHVNVGSGDTVLSEADARGARRFMVRHGIGGIILAAGGAMFGGACTTDTNQRLQTLLGL